MYSTNYKILHIKNTLIRCYAKKINSKYRHLIFNTKVTKIWKGLLSTSLVGNRKVKSQI